MRRESSPTYLFTIHSMAYYFLVILIVSFFLRPILVLGYVVVDLTHIHNNESIRWTTTPDLELTIGHRGPWNSLWYETNTFKTSEHYGTHLDSPAHLHKGSWRVHQIPIKNLVGPGVVIDVKEKAKTNFDYQVTKSDLEDWEIKFGTIPDGAVVLMNSGWSKNYPEPNLVFKTNTPENSSTYHFPSWHEDAIDWLVENRKVHVVGVDTPSNDYGQSRDFPAHVILGSRNIPGIENVANLDKIPQSGSIVVVGVMKLEDGSGCPARVIALVMNDGTSSSNMLIADLLKVFITVVIYAHVLV